ncbi:unnamed protein product [Amoebophrya sp. A120]|nr:unnamed protein product [Amoebophrya sp. A120]|eukprot:GSA120T00021826001.1
MTGLSTSTSPVSRDLTTTATENCEVRLLVFSPTTSLANFVFVAVLVFLLLSFVATLQNGRIWAFLRYPEGISPTQDSLLKAILLPSGSVSSTSRPGILASGRGRLSSSHKRKGEWSLHMREEKLALLRTLFDYPLLGCLPLSLLLNLRDQRHAIDVVSSSSTSSATTLLVPRDHSTTGFLGSIERLLQWLHNPFEVGSLSAGTSPHAFWYPASATVTGKTTEAGCSVSFVAASSAGTSAPASSGAHAAHLSVSSKNEDDSQLSLLAVAYLLPLVVLSGLLFLSLLCGWYRYRCGFRRKEGASHVEVYRGMNFWQVVLESCRQIFPTAVNLLYLTQGISLVCLLLEAVNIHTLNGGAASAASIGKSAALSLIYLGVFLFGFWIPFCLRQFVAHCCLKSSVGLSTSNGEQFANQLWGFLTSGALWEPLYAVEKKMIVKGVLVLLVAGYYVCVTEFSGADFSSTSPKNLDTTLPSLHLLLFLLAVTLLFLHHKDDAFAAFPIAGFAESFQLHLMLATSLIGVWYEGRIKNNSSTTTSPSNQSDADYFLPIDILLVLHTIFVLTTIWKLVGTFILQACGLDFLLPISEEPISAVFTGLKNVLRFVLSTLFSACLRDRDLAAGAAFSSSSSSEDEGDFGNFDEENDINDALSADDSSSSSDTSKSQRSKTSNTTSDRDHGEGAADPEKDETKKQKREVARRRHLALKAKMKRRNKARDAGDLTADDLKLLHGTGVFSLLFGDFVERCREFLFVHESTYGRGHQSQQHLHRRRFVSSHHLIYYYPNVDQDRTGDYSVQSDVLDVTRLNRTGKEVVFLAIRRVCEYFSHLGMSSGMTTGRGSSRAASSSSSSSEHQFATNLPEIYRAVLLRCFVEYASAQMRNLSHRVGRSNAKSTRDDTGAYRKWKTKFRETPDKSRTAKLSLIGLWRTHFDGSFDSDENTSFYLSGGSGGTSSTAEHHQDPSTTRESVLTAILRSATRKMRATKDVWNRRNNKNSSSAAATSSQPTSAKLQPIRRILDDDDDLAIAEAENHVSAGHLLPHDEVKMYRRLPGIPVEQFEKNVFSLLVDRKKKRRLLAQIRIEFGKKSSGGGGRGLSAGMMLNTNLVQFDDNVDNDETDFDGTEASLKKAAGAAGATSRNKKKVEIDDPRGIKQKHSPKSAHSSEVELESVFLSKKSSTDESKDSSSGPARGDLTSSRDTSKISERVAPGTSVLHPADVMKMDGAVLSSSEKEVDFDDNISYYSSDAVPPSTVVSTTKEREKALAKIQPVRVSGKVFGDIPGTTRTTTPAKNDPVSTSATTFDVSRLPTVPMKVPSAFANKNNGFAAEKENKVSKTNGNDPERGRSDSELAEEEF